MKNLARILIISTLLLAACSKVPSHIIGIDDMAGLMADIHTAEAVVEMNYATYPSDSLKLVMRQSVYMRHGVNAATVDSSIAWYGRNIKYYMEVYDKTIEILEHRLIETGNRIAADNALSIAGDSVDVWPNARFISVNDRLPSSIITFSFKRDPNWQSGDAYAWRAKFFNIDEKLEWLIGVEYDNGKVEWINETPDGDGWKELALQTDSLHNPTRLFGYLSAPNKPGTELRIDSVALIRKRLNANNYNRPYTLSIENFNPPVEINDSIANDTVR